MSGWCIQSLLLAGVLATLLVTAPAASQGAKRIALTFDDLPGVSQQSSLAVLEDINQRLLATLRIERVPAVGFVNAQGLEVEGEREARIDLLRRWVGPSLTLGNHTFSHPDLNQVPLADYQADVVKGEPSIRAVLEKRGHKLVWFRHPFTRTGPTPEIKAGLEVFLNERGYRVAPFTIESADYLFAVLYERALMAGDEAQADKVAAAYLDHQDRAVAFAEALAFDTFGRDIPQVLLSHVNRLNADVMPEYIGRLRRRGYIFVTLDSVMDDEAYRTPDRFVGRFGPSWIHRWRVALDKPSRIKDDPDPPAWVMKN
jgi:peptidoglycan/xylan/chitin deacetylase (PgdA/CDA1 family)